MMGLLVVYSLRSTDLLGGSHGIPEAIAVAVTAGLHLWRRNTLLSILSLIHICHQGDEQILRPVVGQLRQFKQVTGQAAHQLAGAVAVVEVEAQLLNVAAQIAADIRLHADAEGVAPVGHHEVQDVYKRQA